MGRGGAEPPTFHFSGVRQGGHEGARAAVSRSGNTLGTSANRAGGTGIDTTTETTNVRTERLCRLARAGASACPPLEGEYSVCHCSSLSSRQGRRAQSDTSSSRSVGRGRGQGDTRPLTTRDWTETGSSHVARLDSGQGRFGHRFGVPDPRPHHAQIFGSGSARPLASENREEEVVGPFALRPCAVHEVPLLAHSYGFEHPGGGRITGIA